MIYIKQNVIVKISLEPEQARAKLQKGITESCPKHTEDKRQNF